MQGKKLLLAALCAYVLGGLLLERQAFAQAVVARHQTNHPTQTITFLASSSLSAPKTFTITNFNGGFAIANLEMARTRSTGTDMAMTCVSTTDTTTPAAQMQTCTYDATGVCTHVQATWKSSTSVSETLGWKVGILGWRRIDCTVSSTAAGAGDLLVVTGGMVTQ